MLGDSFGSLRSEVLGKPVISLDHAFANLEGPTVAPTIPLSVVDVSCCFIRSTIEEASYEGTVEQFKLIEGYDTIGSVIIHCSDGDYPED